MTYSDRECNRSGVSMDNQGRQKSRARDDVNLSHGVDETGVSI